jgi:hypothetical protein
MLFVNETLQPIVFISRSCKIGWPPARLRGLATPTSTKMIVHFFTADGTIPHLITLENSTDGSQFGQITFA